MSQIDLTNAALSSEQLYRLMTTGSTEEKEAPRTIYSVHQQWANRPDDERYESLKLLYKATLRRSRQSQENIIDWYSASTAETDEAAAGQQEVEVSANLPVQYVADGPHAGGLFAVAADDGQPYLFSNWSFSQFNTEIGGPQLSWLRDMPAPIAADAMNSSIQYRNRLAVDGRTKLYLMNPDQDGEPGVMRACTGPEYGRIHDYQVVRAVMEMNERQGGRWVVPGAVAGRGMADMYTEVTKQSTTLYASDRDVFIFLVDEQHPIEIDGDLYFRGFIVTNSEVGKATLEVTTFVLRAICMNRIIHGALQIRKLSIRHTKLAPARWEQDVQPALAAYANTSTRREQAVFRAAKSVNVAKDLAESAKWLRERGFSQTQAVVMVNLAERAADIGSSGDPTNLWNLAMAGTALAREIPHQDTRVLFEEKVGAMMRDHSPWRKLVEADASLVAVS